VRITAALVTHAVETLSDDEAHAARHFGVGELHARAPPPRFVEQLPRLVEMAKHLLHEERIALGLRVHERHQLRWGLGTGAAFEERRDSLFGQATEQELVGQAVAQQLGKHGGQGTSGLETRVAVGPHGEDGELRDPLGHVADQEQRRLVGPVEIFVHEHQRGRARGALHELGDTVEQVAALLLGRERDGLRDVRIARPQLGDELGDLGGVVAERLAERLGRHLAGRLLEVLDDGQVGRRALLVDRVAGEHAQTEPPRLGGRLFDETRLPDAGLAADQHERTCPLACALDGSEQPRPLLTAGNEGGSLSPREDARSFGVCPGDLPEVPGRVDSLERELAAIFELATRRPEDAVHRVRGEDPARGRHRLDALGDDQRLAVQTAFLAQHLPGVETDAQLDGGIGPAPVAAGHGALDLPGAGHRAPRGLEGDHETVARVLDDHASLLRHLLLGERGQLTLHRGGGFVSQPLVEPRGADEIGGEHRHGALGQGGHFSPRADPSAGGGAPAKPGNLARRGRPSPEWPVTRMPRSVGPAPPCGPLPLCIRIGEEPGAALRSA
jgi:hypothetical protein